MKREWRRMGADLRLVRHLFSRGVVGIRRTRCKGRPTRCVLRVWIEWFVPQLRFHSVEVVDDLSVFDGEFGDQLLCAIDACILHVSEAVVAFFYAQHRYVGDGALREIAKVVALDLM